MQGKILCKNILKGCRCFTPTITSAIGRLRIKRKKVQLHEVQDECHIDSCEKGTPLEKIGPAGKIAGENVFGEAVRHSCGEMAKWLRCAEPQCSACS